MSVSEEAYRRAKVHVARGHEEEKARLERKGLGMGAGAGAAAALVHALATKKPNLGHVLTPALAALAGEAVGRPVANRRLETSQMRQRHGYYAPHEKRAEESPTTQTARRVRTQVAAVKRPHIMPPVADAVKPTPQPPAVEPTTLTPTMKAGALEGLRKRGRKSADDALGEPHDSLWSGSLFQPYRKGPENEAVSYRAHDF